MISLQNHRGRLSLNNKHSFRNGENKPFLELFLFVDTSMIPVWAVPELFWNTAKGIRGISIFQLSLYFKFFQFYFQVGQIVPLSRRIAPTTNIIRVSIIIIVRTPNDITGYLVKPRISFYSNCRLYKLSSYVQGQV